MQRLFPLLGDKESCGTQEDLARRLDSLQDKRACGFVELELGERKHTVLLYAHGKHVGTYLVENGNSRRLATAEMGAALDRAPVPMRAVRLADSGLRVGWLALESSPKESPAIQDESALKREIQKWKAENVLGLVELSCGAGQGFAALWPGEFAPVESVYLDLAGNEKNFMDALRSGQKWSAALREIPASSGAFACFALRQGALRWGNSILARFGDVAGLKLAHFTTQALKTLVDTWQWNISINGAAISDAHFFPNAEAAAQAYRAIFMTIGAQMEVVIGNHLSQRILAETFRTLKKEERAVLESRRLIPAAFTD